MPDPFGGAKNAAQVLIDGADGNQNLQPVDWQLQYLGG